MHKRCKAAVAVMLVLAATPTMADAASKAARYLERETATSGCPAGGSFSAGSVVERDLTGDGKLDLVLDQGGLTWKDGSRSINCGVMCDIDIYVREDGLLKLKGGFNAMGFLGIGNGKLPEVKMTGQDGKTWSVRWNGSTFEQ